MNRLSNDNRLNVNVNTDILSSDGIKERTFGRLM